MRYAVSNIAWQPCDRLDAYERLARAGLMGLEIAPGLLFAASTNPFEPSPVELAAMRAEITAAGLTLVSMQSLLFGVAEAQLFGNDDERAAFLAGLYRAIALAERLQIPNLVLGAPKQRLRPRGLDKNTAMDRAADILQPLADAAQAAGTCLAIECNPVDYGANFLTTPEETLAFVRHAGHPAITLNFDMGAAHMTDRFDLVEQLLEDAGPVISHVHLSEPFLAPAPAEPATAARIIKALHAIRYTRAVSIEMRPAKDGLSGLDAALQRLKTAQTLAKGHS